MSKKVLVVQDDRDLLGILTLYFEAVHHHVATASRSDEALSAARAERPDLIIADLSLPNLEGIELIRHIRAQWEFKDVPILAYSTFVADDTRRAFTFIGQF